MGKLTSEKYHKFDAAEQVKTDAGVRELLKASIRTVSGSMVG